MDWKKNTLHEGEITGYTAEGMGVARLEGRVVFIPGTVAGERWRFRLEKVNKAVAWGRDVELLSPSPLRLAPDCPLFGRCGGCQFRHMAYEEELRAKAARIQDALTRIGGSNVVLSGILQAENTERYRNKVQFPVAMEKNGLAVGYYRGRSHDVLDVEDCLLQPEAVTALRAAFKGWMERYAVPPYDEVSRSGLVRQGVRPRVICVDPPRKGLGPEVPEILAAMAPERIVYVSCDPATLARDVKRFSLLGYSAVKAQGVDLFPRTQHVETVCLLARL